MYIKEEGIYIFGGKHQNGHYNKKLYILKTGETHLSWKVAETSGKRPLPRCMHTMNYLHSMLSILIYGGRSDHITEE